MTEAELIERYAEARQRLWGETVPAPRRHLLTSPKPEPHRFPEATRRMAKMPKIIHARTTGGNEVLPLPDAERWKAIISEVCEKYGIDWIELASHRRSVPAVIARHEAMYRMRHETVMSLPAIGRRLGGRDHTSVIHGIRRHEERMAAEAMGQ